jgi:hypothetical protein
VGKRHRRIRALGTTGQVAGAATEKSGSKPIARETACPAYVLPKAPCPGQRTVGPKPDINELPSDSFMPRDATAQFGRYGWIGPRASSVRVRLPANYGRWLCAVGCL